MFALRLLIIWRIQTIPEYPFNMYDANNHQDWYCLSFHWRDTPLLASVEFDGDALFSEQIMSYYRHSTNLNITFAQLRQKNITSEMLLLWSASIDMTEQYQIFLDNYSVASSEDIVYHMFGLARDM